MEDRGIIDLYLARDESAIRETGEKYGRYLTKIAFNVLADEEDSRETVNDTYLRAWESIPPHEPAVLSAFLGKITRQLAIDRLRRRTAKRRQGGQYQLSLSELEECVSAGDVTGEEVDARLLAEAIGAFLRTLPAEARTVFLRRYYFLDSIREVAVRHGMSEGKTKSMLHRTRAALKAYLQKEGFFP